MGLLKTISSQKTKRMPLSNKQGKGQKSESRPFVLDKNKKYSFYTLIPNDAESRTEQVDIIEYDEDGNDCGKYYEYQVPVQLHPFELYAYEVDASYLLDTKIPIGEIGIYDGDQPIIVIQYAEDVNGYKSIPYGEQINSSMQRVIHPVLKYRYEFSTDKVYHVGYLFYKNTEDEREQHFHEVAMEIPKEQVCPSLKYKMLDYLDVIALSLKIKS